MFWTILINHHFVESNCIAASAINNRARQSSQPAYMQLIHTHTSQNPPFLSFPFLPSPLYSAFSQDHYDLLQVGPISDLDLVDATYKRESSVLAPLLSYGAGVSQPSSQSTGARSRSCRAVAARTATLTRHYLPCCPSWGKEVEVFSRPATLTSKWNQPSCAV